MRLYVDISDPARERDLQERLLAAKPGTRVQDIVRDLLYAKLDEGKAEQPEPVVVA